MGSYLTHPYLEVVLIIGCLNSLLQCLPQGVHNRTATPLQTRWFDHEPTLREDGQIGQLPDQRMLESEPAHLRWPTLESDGEQSPELYLVGVNLDDFRGGQNEFGIPITGFGPI